MENLTEDMVYKSLSVLLTIIIAILGWRMQRKTERIKIMENQLSDKKYAAYSELVSLFYSVLQNVKKKESGDPSAMMSNMLESKKNILMYGSDRVVKAFNKWLCSTTMNKSNYQQLDAFLDLMLEMRKDMVGNKTKVSKRDLLVNLIQNEEEVGQIWKKLKE
jgi:hypothetical protein